MNESILMLDLSKQIQRRR